MRSWQRRTRALLALGAAVAAALAGALLGCGGGSGLEVQDTGRSSQGFAWQLPADFPTPLVPSDNPLTEAKAELGRHLFYDKRLSGNGTDATQYLGPVVLVDAHLDRVVAEQGYLQLRLQAQQSGVHPGQRGVVDGVGQALRLSLIHI